VNSQIVIEEDKYEGEKGKFYSLPGKLDPPSERISRSEEAYG
jgi:hypothetical protein